MKAWPHRFRFVLVDRDPLDTILWVKRLKDALDAHSNEVIANVGIQCGDQACFHVGRFVRHGVAEGLATSPFLAGEGIAREGCGKAVVEQTIGGLDVAMSGRGPDSADPFVVD